MNKIYKITVNAHRNSLEDAKYYLGQHSMPLEPKKPEPLSITEDTDPKHVNILKALHKMKNKDWEIYEQIGSFGQSLVWVGSDQYPLSVFSELDPSEIKILNLGHKDQITLRASVYSFEDEQVKTDAEMVGKRLVERLNQAVPVMKEVIGSWQLGAKDD